jgi:hypothetical protein
MSDIHFLDQDGLLYLWSKIKSLLTNYVAKESGKGLSANDFTTIEKTKLANIANNAQVNVIEQISVNGSDVAPVGKKVNVIIPTDNSDLTNGAGYQTATEVSSAIATALRDVTSITYKVVSELPETGSSGTIYLLANSGSGSNIYDEFIYINDAFEKIGTTDIDLSNYSQYSDKITNTEIDTICV